MVRLRVYSDESTRDIANWIVAALQARLTSRLSEVAVVEQDEATFFEHFSSKDEQTAEPLIVITVFLDGQSEAAKACYLSFKTWSASKQGCIIQALNSKKGTHTLFENEDVVCASILKKLTVEDGAPPAQSEPPHAAASKGSVLDAPTLTKKIVDGQGETPWVVVGTAEAFQTEYAAFAKVTAECHCGHFPLVSDPRQLPDGKLAQEFLVRHDVPDRHIELRIAMCGNVDSGKSTLTSVLCHGDKDDGRGLARARVFNHRHEAETGRTSSISENYLGFDAKGGVVNYTSETLAAAKHDVCVSDLARRSAKICTLYDLAGHEKYLKTTVLGMTRSIPDYACIVISANNGIQRMTKEHLGLCLALRLPFYIVVTRIDATPENVQQQTMQSIFKLLKMPTVKKLPYPIKKVDDVIVCSKNLKSDRITPIFEVSNVTGQGIAELLFFINMLPLRKDWSALVKQPQEMVIDSTFFVTGVGTVVGGVIMSGCFRPNDTIQLGPDANGAFRQVQIKSIHVKGVEVDHVDAGNDAALCLRKEKRSAIRKGNVLIDVSLAPKSYWQFEAEILILYHSTTISSNYEPVIHSQTVRQSARIILVNQEVLRTGDRAIVRFHFLYRPEYMKMSMQIIFREGRTKGIGIVTRMIEDMDPAVIGNQKQRVKQQTRDRLEHNK